MKGIFVDWLARVPGFVLLCFVFCCLVLFCFHFVVFYFNGKGFDFYPSMEMILQQSKDFGG